MAQISPLRRTLARHRHEEINTTNSEKEELLKNDKNTSRAIIAGKGSGSINEEDGYLKKLEQSSDAVQVRVVQIN